MRAVIYSRFSSENQSEESITAQIRACTEYAEKNNYDIVKSYIDRAFSARSDARPSFQEMIVDSAAKVFEIVIVHKLDRFSRDRYDHAVYKKQLRKNGVRVVSVLENLDDSPEGVVLESILEGFSEYYSKNLARETRKGLKEVALQAKFTGGTPPFGYDIDSNNNYIVNELEANAVRRIYQACIDGVGYGKLLDEFQSEGIKTKFGKSFGKTSFNAILKNEKYIGRYIYYTDGDAREKKVKPIIIDDALPIVVDKNTFMEVQAIMENRKHTGRLKAVEPYLLSGILLCGECGSPMCGHRRQKNGKVYYAYECSQNTRKKTCDMGSFSRDKIEKLVGEYIKSLFSKETLDVILSYLNENKLTLNQANEKEQLSLKKEISSLETKINNTINLLIEMPSDKLKEKLSELESRQKQVIYDLQKAEASIITSPKLEKYLIRVENFETLTREEKQMFIKKALKKITAYKDGNFEISTTYGEVVDKVGGATRI